MLLVLSSHSHMRVKTANIGYLFHIWNAGPPLLRLDDHVALGVFRRRPQVQIVSDDGLDARAAQRRQPRATAAQVASVAAVGEHPDPLLRAPPSVFVTALHLYFEMRAKRAAG